MYLGVTGFALVVNAGFTRVLPLVTKAAFVWLVGGFVVTSVVVLACASPEYQSGGFVYGGFENLTGWPDGTAWLLGLLQGAFSLTGRLLSPSLWGRGVEIDADKLNERRIRRGGTHD